ncbi:MAG: UTP--glucose-1-phosphate uridylyltransferase GalU [Pyrinomonadaceae bacterium]|nr:UTP--glucose-1-phosphate uridylyltransferase GalU [Pyrinomonadaceae bacterium]
MTKKIRKAVFPAAGLGTRFLPATKSSPKEMLPLVDKPLIQYSIEEAVESGIESILVITGREKSVIANHFDVSFELEQILKEKNKTEMFEMVRGIAEIARISYIRQQLALGLGHAIYQAIDFAENEPFAVLLADDIVDAEKPALAQMIEAYEKYQAPIIATMQVEGEAISRFGVIDAVEVEENIFKINDMVEKPAFEDAPSDLAIIGRYILTPDIFDAIRRTKKGAGGEIQITDAMRLMLSEGKDFYALKLEGKRHDAGDKLGFLIATVEFALQREDLGGEFREYLKSLNLNDDA